MKSLSINFCGIEMKNPIMAASGTFGMGLEYRNYLDLNNDVGAISVKGLTLEPRHGNEGRRIAETPSGLLNCIGLENPGAAAFVKFTLPELRKYDVPIIANISGKTVDEYAEIARVLSVEGIAGFEVNISCPNVKNGGMAFGVCPDSAAEITRVVKANTKLPVMTKLSPNVTDVVEIAKRVEDAGADGISMINTLLGMHIDVETMRPSLGNIFGGLSGPCIKPVALRMVYQVAKAVKIPILGGGGIMTGTDAIEFILAGATAVSVGSATMADPRAIAIIAKEIKEYLDRKNISHISDIVGKAQ